jgi:hypothetical protein
MNSNGSTTEYRFLYAGGLMPDGSATKILWDIENPAAGGELRISGTKLNGTRDTFQQVFPRATSPATNFPSIVNVPSGGGWQLTLTSGQVSGTAVFWVVSA